MPISDVKLMDCMEGMAQFPDKFFDLAVVDPPYGGNNIKGGYLSGKGGGVVGQKQYNQSLWDLGSPTSDYYAELVRVSKNQIIWGANHLCDQLPSISSGWIFWDKMNGDVSFSDGELAWTSFNKGLRKFSFRWSGMLQGNMTSKEIRIHPTQKPIALYQWIFKNYAKPGDKILDTHLGSMSSRIAAYKMGFDFWGFEIDPDYFNDGENRFKKSIAMPLFDVVSTSKQLSMI